MKVVNVGTVGKGIIPRFFCSIFAFFFFNGKNKANYFMKSTAFLTDWVTSSILEELQFLHEK